MPVDIGVERMRASRPPWTAKPAVLTRSIVCMLEPSKRHNPPPVSPMPEPLISNTKSDSPEQANRSGVPAVARGASWRAGSLPGFVFDFPKRRKLNTRCVYPGRSYDESTRRFKMLALCNSVPGGGKDMVHLQMALSSRQNISRALV